MDVHSEIYEAVKAHYLAQGRTEADWAAVTKDPRKFNFVWRHALKIKPEYTPPPAFLRQVNPATGELCGSGE